VPSVFFHVVESTYKPLTVRAEVAGSSPVAPWSDAVSAIGIRDYEARGKLQTKILCDAGSGNSRVVLFVAPFL
jgi:hypothetical protein